MYHHLGGQGFKCELGEAITQLPPVPESVQELSVQALTRAAMTVLIFLISDIRISFLMAGVSQGGPSAHRVYL